MPVSSDLQVDKSFAPTPNPSAGDLVTYTIAVGNAGPSTATQRRSPATCSRPEFYAAGAPSRRAPTPAAAPVPGCRLRASCAAPSPSLDPGRPRRSRSPRGWHPTAAARRCVNSVVRDLGLGRSQPRAGDRHGLVRADPRRRPRADQGPRRRIRWRPATSARYTFQFANRGPSNAPDVILRDTLPDGLTLRRRHRRRVLGGRSGRHLRARRAERGASGELGVDVAVDPYARRARRCATRASIASDPADPSLVPAEVVPSSNFDAADLVVGVPSPSRPADAAGTSPPGTSPPGTSPPGARRRRGRRRRGHRRPGHRRPGHRRPPAASRA